jgi:iron complex outermembrane receptor protein
LTDEVFVRVSASAKTQDGYFDILDYECVNGAGTLGFGGAGITAGVFNTTNELTTALSTHPAIGGIALGSVTGPTDDRGCVVDQLGSENVQSGRVAVRFQPSDTVEVNVVGDLTRIDQQGPADKYTIQLRTTNGVPPTVQLGIDNWNNNVALPVFGPGGQFDGRFQTDDGYTGYHRFGYDPLTRRTTPNVNELTHWGLQATVDWDVTDNVTFKSTTSYREFDNSYGRDSDGTPLPQLFTWDTAKHEQFTQEFQLSGLAGSRERLEWTTGLFYYDAFDSNQGYVNTFTYTSTFSDHKDVQDLNNYAAYAHVVYAITERLNISGGVRYTDDEKLATIYRVTGNTAPPGVGLPQYVLIPNTTVPANAEEWSPKIGVDYQFTDTIMGYAAYSTGFRGGGFSPRPANSLQVAAFDPEYTDSFEIGIKSDWLDSRLRFNGDIYYMETTDKQQPTQTCAPCLPLPVAWFATVNTGESRNWGVEAEILAEPIEQLRIDFSMGYQNYLVTDVGRAAGILVYVPDTAPDESIRGDVMYSPRTPEWNLGFGMQYQFNVGNGATFVPRIDYTWQDDIWFATNPVAGIVNEQDGRQPAYGVVNARVTWTNPDANWSVSAYAINLTDEYYFYGKLSLLANSGREQGNPAAPREVGLNFRYSF